MTRKAENFHSPGKFSIYHGGNLEKMAWDFLLSFFLWIQVGENNANYISNSHDCIRVKLLWYVKEVFVLIKECATQ